VIKSNGNEELLENSGIFMKAFQRELVSRNIYIPFIGVRDCKKRWLKSDLEAVADLFQKASKKA
jgi:hypothetical protein